MIERVTRPTRPAPSEPALPTIDPCDLAVFQIERYDEAGNRIPTNHPRPAHCDQQEPPRMTNEAKAVLATAGALIVLTYLLNRLP